MSGNNPRVIPLEEGWNDEIKAKASPLSPESFGVVVRDPGRPPPAPFAFPRLPPATLQPKGPRPDLRPFRFPFQYIYLAHDLLCLVSFFV